ncbi:MAG TPA: HU family DNA-binding protein [Bacteroidetes bacterium]|nr:HU family DNA-binding protein [Bacteroidota bacterium]
MSHRPKTYIKRDVVEMTAQNTGLDPKVVAPIVDATFSSLREMIINTPGECRIEIRDFGVLQVKFTAPKPKARNPRKPGEEIFIPARRKTHFRPGRKIKEALQIPLDELEKRNKAAGR